MVPRKIGGMLKIQGMNRKVTLEFRDLDCFTKVVEVNKALKKALL